jgi:low affinity Fe/Cu permease
MSPEQALAAKREGAEPEGWDAPEKKGFAYSLNCACEQLAVRATRWTAGTLGFATACTLVVLWVAAGPFLGFSETWLVLFSTSTTTITFLMVFLIQRSQNKDALAIQLKLDEIVAALAGASNRLVAAEDLSEDELAALRRRITGLKKRARRLADEGAPLTHSNAGPAPHRKRKKKRPAPTSSSNGS